MLTKWNLTKVIYKSFADNKEYLGRANVLDEHLDSRLKDVYVTSKGLVIYTV